jgi:hypothetical protein
MEGLPVSTDADTAAAWARWRASYLRRRSDAPDLLDDVVDRDPRLAVAHAWRVLAAIFEGADVDRATEVEASLSGRADEDWERSLVAVVARTHRDGLWPARPDWVRHHERFPADLPSLAVLVFLTVMSTDADRHDKVLELSRRSADAVGEHAMLLGLDAMVLQDQGRLVEAAELASRALELEPTGFDGAHPMAHVHFESGDHGAGSTWLDGWLLNADLRSPFHGHLVWHSALHRLALGDQDGTLERYRSVAARREARTLADRTSLLWRCQLHGLVDSGVDPAGPPTAAEQVAPLTSGVPFTFVGAHVVLGLAAAGDAEGLRRFAATAAGLEAPGAAELLPPLALGFAAHVEGDHAGACDQLLQQERHVVRLGGSNAQREVFEDTLLESLVLAGRQEEAIVRLQARLERRESLLDRNLLARAVPDR